MMSPEQRKQIEERALADAWFGQLAAQCFKIAWGEGRQAKLVERIKLLLIEKIRTLESPALDAAEARAKAAEERVEDLESALEFSYTLACRGVERIDEENKTCGARLSLAHRRRLAIMCSQIKYHKDKWLRDKENDNG